MLLPQIVRSIVVPVCDFHLKPAIRADGGGKSKRSEMYISLLKVEKRSTEDRNLKIDS